MKDELNSANVAQTIGKADFHSPRTIDIKHALHLKYIYQSGRNEWTSFCVVSGNLYKDNASMESPIPIRTFGQVEVAWLLIADDAVSCKPGTISAIWSVNCLHQNYH